MQIRELTIPDAYEITPKQFGDDRGVFLEWYRYDRLSEVVGHPLDLRQANLSSSRKGVVRGIHFADVPRGQAKYVTAPRGAVIDFVVDIRVGSPTFGEWDTVLLDDVDRRAIYIAEGLGHAFVALTDDAVVSYLVSDVYNPAAEHGISPIDPTIALRFPLDASELVLSEKDTSAPTLEAAAAAGLLPDYSQVRAYYDALGGATR
ncbi:dTDP-4-dehydrorhamnose 3,5-epimerase [Protaetiibacter intestinalis]|uniref:dTDP-4-dehydrorhamnose 3,5-epimerase n=1 Tax=Protaetiibacter intestinalis TaxID=2419774 RepID=A0A387BIG9_9MICO|nr:dTDP-4-dehydrorhamnose 3,5-epimerase [Protaetiibacter intestinalis]AYF98330.1 dTDP-4-dehydrorhamnose 3,5-epimerase [Protaetiibacter intestinalis]